MEVHKYRQALVPKWIKFFGWLFILMACFIPVGMIVFTLMDVQATYSIFGWTHVGSPFAVNALLIQGVILFFGISAYGLLFGKSWGVKACLVNGYLGLVIGVVTMFLGGFTTIRLEPLIQIPYLITLHKIKPEWVSKV